MNGIGNYNIVFPGYDHVFGTYHYAKDISEVPNAMQAVASQKAENTPLLA